MQRFAAAAASGLAALLASGSAVAQESAVRSAADAFGERVGLEQLGLYNESQVRGFDLQASGAYRINDAYFVRAAPLNDPVLAGVGVRVGVNAARLPYPAPSGVVNYRLREPAATNQLTLGGGLREFGTTVVEANGSWRAADDRTSITAGLVVRPTARWSGGTEGEAIDFGLVGRLRLGETQRLTAFATIYDRDYDGDYAFKALGGALPPNPRSLHNYGPGGARVDAASVNLGLLYGVELGGWTVDASAFRSIYDARRSDFTTIRAQPNGDATATLSLLPHRTNVSDSGEIRATRVFSHGEINHLISGSLRLRRSTVDLASTVAVPIGPFTLQDGRVPDAPSLIWSGTRGQDLIEQTTASLGYGLAWADRIQIRLGVHRTRYEKTVNGLTGVTTSATEETTLYNASAIWSPTPRTSVFASWVTGLEETGVAPQTAVNANEVLAPVEAEQRELGLRHSFGDLTLITALFEVSKPTTGFRADGSFGLVGEVAHRGIEASLAGRIGERTSVVVGAVAFEPEVSGELVEAGVIGDRPPGISEVVANASIERQLATGWSVDAQATYNGERWVDSRNSFQAPAVTTFNLGVRRRFEIAGRPAQLRVIGTNIFNQDGYWANPSLLMSQIGPRTLRATLTLTFN